MRMLLVKVGEKTVEPTKMRKVDDRDVPFSLFAAPVLSGTLAAIEGEYQEQEGSFSRSRRAIFEKTRRDFVGMMDCFREVEEEFAAEDSRMTHLSGVAAKAEHDFQGLRTLIKEATPAHIQALKRKECQRAIGIECTHGSRTDGAVEDSEQPETSDESFMGDYCP